MTPGGDTFFLTFQNNSTGAGDYTTNKTGFSGGTLLFGGSQAAASLVMAAAVMDVPVSGGVAVFAKSENPANVSRETIVSSSRRTADQIAATDRAVTELAQPARDDTASGRRLRTGRMHRRAAMELFSAGGA